VVGRWNRTVLCALALLTALSGCSVGSAYRRPDVPVAGSWHDSEANLAVAWPAADWWRGFGSPQLDAFIEQARRANYDVAAAAARVREADAQARIAGAALLPSIAAAADVSRQGQPSSGRSNGSTSMQHSLTLTATYEVDFWGRNHAFLSSAKALALSSRYDRDTIGITVETSVATTYFQVLGLRDRLAVARDNLANAQEILKTLNARRVAGIATALEVAQQETNVAVLSAQIPPLEQQLRQNINALAILLGEPPQSLDITTGALAELSQPVVSPGLPSELLARRPDVASAEALLVAANANINASRAAFFPSVQLTAQGGFASAALSSLFNPSSALFSLAGSLVQPIFEGGRLKGQLELSQARYDELVQAYRKAIVTAFGDVENALVATKQTADQEQRQQIAVDTARHAYDISVAQLRAGTVDVLTVLNTQNALFTARDVLTQVKLGRMQSSVSLFKALGGGWQQTSTQSVTG
jgi:multidrug efflux system outer membrane protein